MTEESSGSGSFNAFWQKSKDKVAFKSVKFMPNTTNPGKGKKSVSKGAGASDGERADGGGSSNLTAKQRRRAQVRKAQIEHRQRKENYVKHLEQDVINLREMIAQTETESVLFKFENEGIKNVLTKANVIVPDSTSTDIPPRQDDFEELMGLASFQQENHQGDFSSSNSPLENMLISSTFDEWIDSTILQISPTHSHVSHGSSGNEAQFPTSLPGPDPHDDPMDIYNATDIYNFPNAFTTPQISNPPPAIPNINSNQAALANLSLDASLSKPLPNLPPPSPNQPPKKTLTYPDLSTAAINFILALEHPCRTHFHPTPSTFNPTSPPSNHELMASTLLYQTAPSTIYTPDENIPFENASWTAPSLELKQLWEMSRSLPKGDWEITPVQAWFLLVERYGVKDLLDLGSEDDVGGVGGGKGGLGGRGLGIGGGRKEGVLDRLKRGLGKVVDCFHFGAVMDEGRFWEVIESELGVPREGGKGKEKEKEKEGGWV